VWLHARVLRGREAGCKILADHRAGSSEQERVCRRAPMITARGGSLLPMIVVWERGHGGCWVKG